jgi:probable phosphoglycerate mutase
VLVRHGVTDATTSGRVSGRGGHDVSLNAEGQRQARAVATGVRAFLGDVPARVVSSSLARAKQTGQAVAAALGARCEQDDGWDEIGFGDWEGSTMAELNAADPTVMARALGDDDDFAPPGGESRRELGLRVGDALNRALAPGGAVVVVAHRGSLSAALAHLLGLTHRQVLPLATSPASLTSVRVWADGVVLVEFVNDTSHLRASDQVAG